LGNTDHMPQIFRMLNALSTREDRYELMDVLCLYLEITNEWVLKAYSSTSPRQALTEHLTYKSPAWHREHAALESHIRQGDLEAVRAAYQLAVSGSAEAPILKGLQIALAETAEWGPLAVMTAAWLLLAKR
jgi:hypothetical protein